MPEPKRTPFYSHIVDALTDRITSGEFPPGAKLPSMREIAETYKVAKSTVERALYRLVDCGILKSQQGKGHFVANTVPRRTDGQTRVIGFLAPMHAGVYIGTGFYGQVLAGIQEALADGDRSLLVINERGLGRADPSADLREQLVDAYIVIGPVGNKFVNLVRRVGRPVVFVDHDASGMAHDSVIADNVKGAAEMTKHLLDLGHRDIVFLGGLLKSAPDPQDTHYIDTAARERYNGFRIAMEMSGEKVTEEQHLWKVEERVAEEAYKTVEEQWENGRKPTGIVCFGSSDAAGAMRYFAKKKIRVPQDVSIVGFGAGEKIEGRVLSGADFDARKMGRIAGEIAINRIQRGFDAFRCEMVPVTFVAGETTGPPRKG